MIIIKHNFDYSDNAIKPLIYCKKGNYVSNIHMHKSTKLYALTVTHKDTHMNLMSICRLNFQMIFSIFDLLILGFGCRFLVLCGRWTLK